VNCRYWFYQDGVCKRPVPVSVEAHINDALSEIRRTIIRDSSDTCEDFRERSTPLTVAEVQEARTRQNKARN